MNEGFVSLTGEQIIAKTGAMRTAINERVRKRKDALDARRAQRRWWYDTFFDASEEISLHLAETRRDELETWVRLAQSSPSSEFRLPKSDATWFLL